ncbi:MAG: CoA transferase [Elusimicrobia bacterium]|nr:CoA transferase [Elusimicrobiota bacterium]
MANSALHSVRILDFSKLLPGPYCTKILSDLGCEVIKVELPYWPDIMRAMPPLLGREGAVFSALHSRKKSLCVDFKKPEGRRILFELLGTTDVLVEGFRPGLMRRLGLGPKDLLKRFPKLVYCSLTGFGQAGPRFQMAGHDLNFLALSGLLSLGGPASGPALPPIQVADIAGGSLYAVIGILAALLDRQKTGRGRFVDISMLEGILSCGIVPLAYQHAAGDNLRAGKMWWNGAHPFYNLYKTQDGRYLAVGALEKGFAQSLLSLIGRNDLSGRALSPLENSKFLSRELEKTFAQKKLRRWMEVFDGKDACVTPVYHLEEAIQAQKLPLRSLIAASPLKMSGALPLRSAMRLGRDNVPLLKSLGYSAQKIRRLKTSGVIADKPLRSGKVF